MKYVSSNNTPYVDDLSKIATGAGVNFAGTAIRALFALAFNLLLARVLTTSDLGLYATGFMITLLVSVFCTLGLDIGLWKFVSSFIARGDRASVRGVILQALALGTAVGLAATVIIILLADEISLIIFDNTDLALPLQVFAITIPFLIAARLFNAATQGMKHMKYAAIRDAVEHMLRFILTGILFFAGFRLGGALAGNLLSIVIIAILSFYFLERLYPILTTRYATQSNFSELIEFSLPMGVSILLTQLMIWLDTLFLGYFRSAEEVGLYSIAIKLIIMSAIFLTSFSTMFAPIISGLLSNKNHFEMDRLFKRITRWVLTLTLPIYTILILFSQPILGIFGEKFETVALSLIILSSGQLIVTATGPVGTIIAMSGRSKLEMFNSLIAVLTSISLCFLLIPEWGITGAAIANASAASVAYICRALEVFIIFRLHPYGVEHLKPVLFAVVAGAISYIGFMYVDFRHEYLSLGLWLLFFILIYGTTIYRYSFDNEDADVTRSIKSRIFQS